MLVAWVVSPGIVSEQAIRASLAERLPFHEVPARIVQVDSLPTGPSGKIDKKALPVPPPPGLDPMRIGPTIDFVTSVWSAIFGVRDVPADANFFDFGGTSLLALNMFQLLRDRYQTMEMTDVFRYPTVRSLAARIDSSSETRSVHATGQTNSRRASLDRARRR